MKRDTWIWIVWMGLAGTILSCATPIPPSGGAKDTTPPKLDSIESTPNQQINFSEQDIYLAFDEWVQLNDPFNQVVISPPLDHLPEIKLKSKGVQVRFHENEVLRENTTYTINFGSAIQDLTEGNAMENFSFIFSTGPYIDSLSISGRMINALTGEPEPDALLILQDNLSDTAIQKVRPAYFAKSNESGTFKINNIRNDTFQVFALKDLNLNYLFDQEGEWIGFLDTMLLIDNPIELPISVTIFEPENLYVKEVIAGRPGNVRISLNKTSPIAGLQTTLPDEQVAWYQEKDTVRLWYMSEDTNAWSLFLALDDERQDTIEVNPVIPVPAQTLKFTSINASRTKGLHPDQQLEITLPAPLQTVTDTLIIIMESDSIKMPVPEVQTDTTYGNMILVNFNKTEGLGYEIILLPDALTDILGNTNDTLRHLFSVGEKKSYGNILVTPGGLVDTLNYVLQVLSGDNVLFEQMLDPGSAEKIAFRNLPPAKYTLKLIEDRNNNGRWDTGDLEKKRQPENLLLKELESLRAGWDMEITVNWLSK